MIDIPEHPIDGLDTWSAVELKSDDRWIHQLSNSDQAELQSAVNQVKSNGLDIFRFGRNDFNLPTLGPRIHAIMTDVEKGRGYSKDVTTLAAIAAPRPATLSQRTSALEEAKL